MLKTIQSYGGVLVSFLKKHKKSSISIGIVLVAYGIYTIFFLPSTTTTTTITEIKVAQKSFSLSVSGSGAISPINTVTLKAKGSGDIRSIQVKAGDTVRQGARLISLDATTAYQNLTTAQVNLETAKLDLEKIKKPPTTLEVLQIQNQIDTAKQTILDQDTAVINAYTSLMNVSFEATPESQASAQTPPTITGSYLGKTEGQIKIISYLSGDGLRFTASGLVSMDGLASTLTAQPLGDTGLYIKFASLDAQPNWIIFIPNKKASSYLSAYTAYQNALITKDKTVAAQNRTLALLAEQMKTLQAGADTLDVRAKELVVAQRQNAVNDASTQLANYTVAAPFDGVIASITAEMGDSVSQSTSLGTIITNKKIAEISLNEADIAKVAVGQKVKLTFDAVSGLSLDGTIAEIDTLGTTSQGVVTYKVKIAFDDKDARIKPGMTVTADITLEKKDDALVVPNEAIKTLKGKKYVEVKTSTSGALTTSQVEVTVGMVGDTQSEITSGVTMGDVIIVRRKTTTASATKTPTAASLLGGNASGAARRNTGDQPGF
ncbi:MAG: efflux RND transporter periplasmic adaptor subunit [Candidatus Paceibacterota bacterium]